jgi:hypothetical protein
MDSFNPLREEVHQVKNAGENPVEHTFDKGYWERHWEELREAGQEATGAGPGNPYIARETAELPPGTALDAGCGEGVEAMLSEPIFPRLPCPRPPPVPRPVLCGARCVGSKPTSRPGSRSSSLTW